MIVRKRRDLFQIITTNLSVYPKGKTIYHHHHHHRFFFFLISHNSTSSLLFLLYWRRSKKCNHKKKWPFYMHSSYWFHTISSCSYTRGRLYKNFRLLDTHIHIHMTEVKIERKEKEKDELSYILKGKKRRLLIDEFWLPT